MEKNVMNQEEVMRTVANMEADVLTLARGISEDKHHPNVEPCIAVANAIKLALFYLKRHGILDTLKCTIFDTIESYIPEGAEKEMTISDGVVKNYYDGIIVDFIKKAVRHLGDICSHFSDEETYVQLSSQGIGSIHRAFGGSYIKTIYEVSAIEKIVAMLCEIPNDIFAKCYKNIVKINIKGSCISENYDFIFKQVNIAQDDSVVMRLGLEDVMIPTQIAKGEITLLPFYKNDDDCEPTWKWYERTNNRSVLNSIYQIVVIDSQCTKDFAERYNVFSCQPFDSFSLNSNAGFEYISRHPNSDLRTEASNLYNSLLANVNENQPKNDWETKYDMDLFYEHFLKETQLKPTVWFDCDITPAETEPVEDVIRHRIDKKIGRYVKVTHRQKYYERNRKYWEDVIRPLVEENLLEKVILFNDCLIFFFNAAKQSDQIIFVKAEHLFFDSNRAISAEYNKSQKDALLVEMGTNCISKHCRFISQQEMLRHGCSLSPISYWDNNNNSDLVADTLRSIFNRLKEHNFGSIFQYLYTAIRKYSGLPSRFDKKIILTDGLFINGEEELLTDYPEESTNVLLELYLNHINSHSRFHYTLIQLSDVLSIKQGEKIKGDSLQYFCSNSFPQDVLLCQIDSKTLPFGKFSEPVPSFQEDSLIISKINFKSVYCTCNENPFVVGNPDDSHIWDFYQIFSIDTEKVSPDYLCYALSLDICLQQFYSYQGMAYNGIRDEKILGIKIPIPVDINVQHLILNQLRRSKYENDKSQLASAYGDWDKQKIEDLRSFTHSLSHPLVGINAAMNLIHSYCVQNCNMKDIVSKRRQQTLEDLFSYLFKELEFMANLFKQGADILDIDKYAIQPTSISELVQAFANYHSDKFDIIVLNRENEKVIPQIMGNVNLFQILANNILSNAERHAFVDAKRKEGNVVKVEIDQDEKYCAIRVSNNGVPFPNDFGQKEFVRRYSSAGETKGSGLGGSDIERIVRHLGGEFTLELNKELEFPTSYVLRFPILNYSSK